MHRNSDERGASLIESLVGLGLLSVWFVGLSTLSVSTIRSTNTVTYMTAAVSLASDKMEEIQATAVEDVVTGADGSRLSADGTPSSGGLFERSWTVAAGPTAGTKETTVRVTWGDAEPRTVELKTILWE